MNGYKLALIGTASLGLIACGGGGGGGISVPVKDANFESVNDAADAAQYSNDVPFGLLRDMINVSNLHTDHLLAEDNETCDTGTATTADAGRITTITFTDCVANGSTINGTIRNNFMSGNGESDYEQDYTADITVSTGGADAISKGQFKIVKIDSSAAATTEVDLSFTASRYETIADGITVTAFSVEINEAYATSSKGADEIYNYDYTLTATRNDGSDAPTFDFSTPDQLTYNLSQDTRDGVARVEGGNNSYLEVTMSGASGSGANYVADGDGDGTLDRTGSTTVDYEAESENLNNN